MATYEATVVELVIVSATREAREATVVELVIVSATREQSAAPRFTTPGVRIIRR